MSNLHHLARVVAQCSAQPAGSQCLCGGHLGRIVPPPSAHPGLDNGRLLINRVLYGRFIPEIRPKE